MDKIDFKKTLSGCRAPHGTFEITEVPTMKYLMINGHQDPNSSDAYPAAIAIPYPEAYES
ncbi:hypothetical protein CQ018_17700 [Arthrobacter sp. MYb227]|uniref:hypothetical protein n=1 Tax=Arthrobacter sp. MYb227 TaxID=1848601 RepID=UPI000CFD843C|nr:hypothetical protein [Arthrobacter sp. MYb227]PQZ87296.1 hypothetical protein CQ018_17700 [Arthrobacter sp. MYb227]